MGGDGWCGACLQLHGADSSRFGGRKPVTTTQKTAHTVGMCAGHKAIVMSQCKMQCCYPMSHLLAACRPEPEAYNKSLSECCSSAILYRPPSSLQTQFPSTSLPVHLLGLGCRRRRLVFKCRSHPLRPQYISCRTM